MQLNNFTTLMYLAQTLLFFDHFIVLKHSMVSGITYNVLLLKVLLRELGSPFNNIFCRHRKSQNCKENIAIKEGGSREPILVHFFYQFDGISHLIYRQVESSVTSKKSPNVYKTCPKMISLEKLKILTPLQILPQSVGDLGNLIAAKGFEKLPKVE